MAKNEKFDNLNEKLDNLIDEIKNLTSVISEMYQRQSKNDSIDFQFNDILNEIGRRYSSEVKFQAREIIEKYIENIKKMGSKSFNNEELSKELKKIGIVSNDIMEKIKTVAEDIKIDIIIDGLTEAEKKIIKSIMSPINKIIEKIKSNPLGKILYESLGLDEFKYKATKRFVESAKNFKAIFKEAAESGKTGIQKASFIGKKSLKELGALVKSAITGTSKLIQTSIGSAMAVATAATLGIVLAIYLIYKALEFVYKQWNRQFEVAKSIRDETGLLAKDSLDLSMGATEIATKWGYLGISVEDVGKAIIGLVNEFQSASVVSDGMKANVAIMAKSFGLSEENGAKVVKLIKTMGVDSDLMATKLIASVGALSTAAGVAPVEVLKDMVNSSNEINTYFGDNVKLAAKTAVELRRMGTSLKDAAAISKNLLQFESSITAELEASVLLGRNIDLSRARYSAWRGDLEGATKEILNQVGSLEDFNKLMPYQREALAKATGMEVDQLTNLLMQQEKLSKLTSEEKEKYKEMQKEMDNWRSANERSLLAEQQRNFAQEKFADIWDNLIYSLTSIVMPIFDAIQQVLEYIAKKIQEAFGSGEMQDGIGGARDMLKSMLEDLKPVIKNIIDKLVPHIPLIIKGIVVGIKLFSSFLMSTITPIITLLEAFEALFSGNIMEAGQKFLESILQSILVPIRYILGFVDNIFGTNILGVFDTIVEYISYIGYLIGIVFSIVRDIGIHIYNAFSIPIDIIMIIIDLITGNITDAMRGVAVLIGDVLKFLVSGVLILIGWLLDVGNAVTDSIPSSSEVRRSANAQINEMLSIPGAASGGIVTSPQQLVVGEAGPEIIIPLNKLDSVIDDVGGEKKENHSVIKKLDELIDAVRSMKIVMDHREVGEIIAKNTPKPGVA